MTFLHRFHLKFSPCFCDELVITFWGLTVFVGDFEFIRERFVIVNPTYERLDIVAEALIRKAQADEAARDENDQDDNDHLERVLEVQSFQIVHFHCGWAFEAKADYGGVCDFVAVMAARKRTIGGKGTWDRSSIFKEPHS